MAKVEQTEFWTDASLQASSCAVASPPMRTAVLPEAPDRTLAEPVSAVRERVAVIHRIEEEEPDLFVGPDLGPAPDSSPAVSEAEPAGYWRHRAARAGPVYAQKPNPETRFNMARFLTLTGSLDSGDRSDRWFVLPRRRYRAQLDLGMQGTDTHDTLKDLRSAPRGFNLISFIRGRGWLGP